MGKSALAQVQPWFSWKWRFSTGTFTLSRKTSLTSWAALQGDDRPDADPRALHVDQQERDAGLRLGVRVGADQEEAPVGELAERRPRLLALTM